MMPSQECLLPAATCLRSDATAIIAEVHVRYPIDKRRDHFTIPKIRPRDRTCVSILRREHLSWPFQKMSHWAIFATRKGVMTGRAMYTQSWSWRPKTQSRDNSDGVSYYMTTRTLLLQTMYVYSCSSVDQPTLIADR